MTTYDFSLPLCLECGPTAEVDEEGYCVEHGESAVGPYAKAYHDLKARIKDAEEVIDVLSSCIDGYYVQTGHSKMTIHEEYDAKWRRNNG